MDYLKSIERLTSPNMGGVVAIRVARAQDVISIQEPSSGIIYGNIIFMAGRGFHLWNVTSQTARMLSNSKKTKEGILKENQLTFTIAKDTPISQDIMSISEHDEFIVLYKDANGNEKLFGTKSKPIKFKYSSDSNKSHADINSLSCHFYYKGLGNISFYKGMIPAPPVGAPPVIIQWNGVTQTTAESGDVVNIISEFKIDDFQININIS